MKKRTAIMRTEKKRQLIERLQDIRNGGEGTLHILISATSGEIDIANRQTINRVLDFLYKELQMNIAEEVENG